MDRIPENTGEYVADLIQQAELDKAIQVIICFAKAKSSSYQKEAIAIAMQLRLLKRAVLSDRIGWEDEKVTKSQLAVRMFELMEIISEPEVKDTVSNEMIFEMLTEIQSDLKELSEEIRLTRKEIGLLDDSLKQPGS